MTSGRIGAELAVVAAFCVLTIFLFPAVQGPYSTVNGPVTALQAVRAAARLHLVIIQCALKSLRDPAFLLLIVFFRMGPPVAGCKPIRLAECTSILRC